MIDEVALLAIQLEAIANKYLFIGYLVLPIYCVYYLFTHNIVLTDAMHSGMIFFFGGSVFSQYFLKDVVYKLIDRVYDYMEYTKRKQSYTQYMEKLNKIKQECEANGQVLKQEHITGFTNMADYYIARVYDSRGAFFKKDKAHIKYLHEHLDLYIKVCFMQIKPYPKLTEDEINTLINKLDTFAKDYEDVENHVINPLILLSLEENMKKFVPIPPVYLSGSPGTGKTRFVKRLADILGADIVEYKTSNNQNDVYLDTGKPVDSQLNQYNAVTKLMMSDNRYKIFFIDELPKHLKADIRLAPMLLTILGDTNDRFIWDNALWANVPISNNVLFMFTGNNTLDQICSEYTEHTPFRSRLVEIKVSNMEKCVQVRLLCEYMKNIHTNTDECDIEFIKKLVDNTNYGGLRELLNLVISYVHHINSIDKIKKYKQVQSKVLFHDKIIDKLKMTQTLGSADTLLLND